MSSVHVHEFLAFLKEVRPDWRTVKRYLSSDAPAGPPSRRGTVARKIDALAPVVDAWSATDPRLKASVIHERLVAERRANRPGDRTDRPTPLEQGIGFQIFLPCEH
jgi:hypothetical protein